MVPTAFYIFNSVYCNASVLSCRKLRNFPHNRPPQEVFVRAGATVDAMHLMCIPRFLQEARADICIHSVGLCVLLRPYKDRQCEGLGTLGR